MRDENDRATSELDGIQAPTPQGASGRKAQGWIATAAREGCRTCRHRKAFIVEPDTQFERVILKCGVGGFITARGAICGLHEAGKGNE